MIERFETVLPEDGTLETSLEGVTLFRLSHPIDRIPGIYPPAACVILQGAKYAYFRGGVHRYDSTQYLCSAMPLPVEGEVRQATPAEPLLGMMISFETRAMAEACVAYEAATSLQDPPPSETEGFRTPTWDAPFRAALQNVLEALVDPVLMQLTGQGRLNELLVAILRSEAGPMICRRVRRDRSVLRVITHIRSNLAGELSVEALARMAAMSRPAFHRHFRRATSLTPIQFIKALRLNEGARLIAQGMAVGTAASQVGYASPSQFSREFKRQFGHSPGRWRNTGAAAQLDPQDTA